MTDTPNGQMTAAEIRQAYTLEKQARERACLDELYAVLKKHGCEWSAVPGIVDGRIVAQIVVTAT